MVKDLGQRIGNGFKAMNWKGCGVKVWKLFRTEGGEGIRDGG